MSESSASTARAKTAGLPPRRSSSASANGSGSSVPSSPAGPLWSHVGYHRTTIAPEATFDPSSAQIKQDVLGLIVQYLQQEGFAMASATIQDEANVKLLGKAQDREALRRMRKAILEGDWDLVAKLIHKHLRRFHSQQGFLYAVCKQEYLELIDRQEFQKAFTFLTTHLKPLERIAATANRGEFKDLCYLLTCKSVAEVDAFRDWEGVARSREKLVEQLRATFELDDIVSAQDDGSSHGNPRAASAGGAMLDVPENRLVQLLHQSVAYQMEFSRYHPKTVPKVSTLLRDFECEVLPNAVKSTYVGHAQNVKFVTFVGQDGEFLASGSSDATVKLWPVEFDADTDDAAESGDESARDPAMGGVCRSYARDLRGHSSRIWYLTSSASGEMLFSGSGDGTVKIWDLRSALGEFAAADAESDDRDNSRRGHFVSSSSSSSLLLDGSATYIPDGMSLVSDDCVATLRCPGGNGAGDVYSVNLHPSETHVVTGGYDQAVRLFDIETGAVAKTFRGHLASVCDAQFNRHANLIVSGSKDGSIRLWDILSGLCVHTLRQTLGEVTSVSVASNGYTLLSGSRNNSNRLWDLRMLHAPRAHLSTHGSHHGGSSHAHGGGGNSGGIGASSLLNGGVSAGGSNGQLSSLATGLASGYSSSSSSLSGMGGVFGRGGSSSSGLGGSSSSGGAKPIQRFKGHQNTAKNIVRASFGPREAFVLGGSEDGRVYVWDVATGKLLETLPGHRGVTYNAKWHEKQALMASSSHDGTVKTWWWRDDRPVR